MKLILVLAFTMPAPALAKDYCESLAGIQSKVNYCDENTAFVKPAEQCRDLFAANKIGRAHF